MFNKSGTPLKVKTKQNANESLMDKTLIEIRNCTPVRYNSNLKSVLKVKGY